MSCLFGALAYYGVVAFVVDLVFLFLGCVAEEGSRFRNWCDIAHFYAAVIIIFCRADSTQIFVSV